jgi:SAM-dependent methyltransferase
VNRWAQPQTVAGFVTSAPNATLMQYAERERARGGGRALDIGCGAARNAVPLARCGWDVLGTDTSWPMLEAAAQRVRDEVPGGRVLLAAAAMDHLPVVDRCADLIIAHGIWNLARSGVEFRAGIREAARAARPGAGLFLFTFSRNTLSPGATSLPGDPFVFTEFSGEPQCFLTAGQITDEMARAGFSADPALPLKELNRPAGLQAASGPVIFEGAFRAR